MRTFQGKCPQCGAPTTLVVEDDDCPVEWVHKLAPAVSCEACKAAAERRRAERKVAEQSVSRRDWLAASKPQQLKLPHPDD